MTSPFPGRVVLAASVLLAPLVAPIAALAALAAPAQSTWPNKPTHFVVPHPPSGGTDVIARIVQEGFAKALGKVVDAELVKWGKLVKGANIHCE